MFVQTAEARARRIKEEFDHTDRAVAMFGNMDFREVLFFGREIFGAIIFIGSLAVDEHHHVRVLFDGT